MSIVVTSNGLTVTATIDISVIPSYAPGGTNQGIWINWGDDTASSQPYLWGDYGMDMIGSPIHYPPGPRGGMYGTLPGGTNTATRLDLFYNEAMSVSGNTATATHTYSSPGDYQIFATQLDKGVQDGGDDGSYDYAHYSFLLPASENSVTGATTGSTHTITVKGMDANHNVLVTDSHTIAYSSVRDTVTTACPRGAIQWVDSNPLGFSSQWNWESEIWRKIIMSSPTKFPVSCMIGDMENADLRSDSDYFALKNVNKVVGGFTFYRYPRNFLAIDAPTGSGYDRYGQPSSNHGNSFGLPGNGDQVTQQDVLSTYPEPYGDYEYDVTVTNTDSSWITFSGIPNMGNPIAWSASLYGGSDTSDYDTRAYRGTCFSIKEVAGLVSPNWGTATFTGLNAETSATNGQNAGFAASALVSGVGNLNPSTFFNNVTVKGHFELRFWGNKADAQKTSTATYYKGGSSTAIMVNGSDTGKRWSDLYGAHPSYGSYYRAGSHNKSPTYTFTNVTATVSGSTVYLPLNYTMPGGITASVWDGQDSSDGSYDQITDSLRFVITEFTTTPQ